MKYLFIFLSAFLFACSDHTKVRVCEYAGGQIIDKNTYAFSYMKIMYKGEVEIMEFHQIDSAYQVGDIIGNCIK